MRSSSPEMQVAADRHSHHSHRNIRRTERQRSAGWSWRPCGRPSVRRREAQGTARLYPQVESEGRREKGAVARILAEDSRALIAAKAGHVAQLPAGGGSAGRADVRPLLVRGPVKTVGRMRAVGLVGPVFSRYFILLPSVRRHHLPGLDVGKRGAAALAKKPDLIAAIQIRIHPPGDGLAVVSEYFHHRVVDKHA